MEGLIHAARFEVRTKGARDAQGERALSAPGFSAWVDARLMERGAVAARTRRRAGMSSEARVGRGYELLLGPIDRAGAAIEPKAGDIVQTDCPVLGSPTIELDGEPERLNNGEETIGWLAYATKPKDRR